MEYLETIFRYWWVKFLATIPLCFIDFTQDSIEIMHGIIYIVILDTILGIWVSLKYKRFDSHRLSRLAAKVSRYGLAMGSVWVLASVEPSIFGWSVRWLGIFIILTEIMSNFEKLSLLGFKMPTKFLAKLNKDYMKFYEAEDKNKDELAEGIIEKRDNKKM